ncbi:MAG: hypothetical protein IJZ68_08085 [Bacteroidaceae bacterium]|nr:hypothetical protein [Bacteroidaceae bacterium]
MANNTKAYTFTQFQNACMTTYDTSMAAMAAIAQNYLCDFFFSQLPARAQCADDKPIVLKRAHIQEYISRQEKENRTVAVNWPIEDVTSQVMFFIVGCLKGVPVLYTNHAKNVSVQNHLVNPDATDAYYKVSVGDKDGGKNGEIIIDMAVGLPTGFYDPVRETVKAAQKQAADNVAAKNAADEAELPESIL